MSSDVHLGQRDPHDVLNVPRGADRQQVIAAFRRKVRQGGHPDTGGDARAFEEIVRARDALIERAQRSVSSHRSEPNRHGTAATTGRVPNTEPLRDHHSAHSVHRRPGSTPPRETHKLAIVTVMLAVLGPLFWPIAIVVGHLALHRIKVTGLGGGTVVPIVLLFLYVLTLPILARVLSIVLIP